MSKITIHEEGKPQYTRDMTSEEEAQRTKDLEEVKRIADIIAAEDNKRKSGRDKLIGLGLTSDEVDALVGGITS